MKYKISDELIDLERANMSKALGKLKVNYSENHAKVVAAANKKLKELKKQGICAV